MLFFCSLYLLARYTKLHTTLPSWSFGKCLKLYLLLLISETIVIWGGNYFSPHPMGSWILTIKTFEYTSPNVILLSLLTLLLFNSIKFQSKFVNWMGISSFAAVIVHVRMFHPMDLHGYSNFIKGIFSSWSAVEAAGIVFAVMIGIFFGSIVIDKIRIMLWNGLLQLFEKCQK